MSTDEMGKFELKEIKRISPFKTLGIINYIPQPIRKIVDRFKDKVISLFKTNTPKQTVYGRGKKLSKPKAQNIRNPFILKSKKEIKDRIITNIWTLFETEEEKEERKKLETKIKLMIDLLKIE